MRSTPLLILVLLYVISGTSLEAVADDQSIEASTVVEPVIIGQSTELDQGPAAGGGSTSAGTFDLYLLLSISLGIAGLVWIRRFDRSS